MLRDVNPRGTQSRLRDAHLSLFPLPNHPNIGEWAGLLGMASPSESSPREL